MNIKKEIFLMSNTFQPIQDVKWNSIIKNDIKWDYALLGEGEDTIIFFPGGMRRQVYGEGFIKELIHEFRVLIPLYPRISMLSPMVEGIVNIMNQESISDAHLYGSSFGGLMAQAFMYYEPKKVKNVVISNTGTINKDQTYEKKIKRFLFLIRLVPAFIVRKIMFKSFSNLIPAEIENREQILQYLRSVIWSKTLDKQDILCHFESLIDFQINIKITPENTTQLQKRMLIITAENDPGVSPTASQSLKEIYPNAQFYHFMEGGHIPLLVKPKIYLNLVKNHFTKDFQ